MGVELCEDVFDVIVYGGGADVELIRDLSCAVTLCQTLQDFNFPRRQAYVHGRRRHCLRAYKFTERLFESLQCLARPNNIDSVAHSRNRVTHDQRRQITPELPAPSLNSQIKVRPQTISQSRTFNHAVLGTNWTILIRALKNFMTLNIDCLCFT